MKNFSCEVLIIGAGPSGLATALNLSSNGFKDLLVIDSGKDLENRRIKSSYAINKDIASCDISSGVGGASGVNGGKLCFFPAGERLVNKCGQSNDSANQRVLDFLLNQHLLKIDIGDLNFKFEADGNLSLKIYPVFILNEKEMMSFFSGFIRKINSKGMKIISRLSVTSIIEGNNGYKYIAKCKSNSGEVIDINIKNSIVIATGRTGISFSEKTKRNLGIFSEQAKVDFGVRLEIPSLLLNTLPKEFQDPKFIISHNDSVETRTLCWCRGGEITKLIIRHQTLIDGHFGKDFSDKTGVSIVARSQVPIGVDPFIFAQEHFSQEILNSGPFCSHINVFLNSNFSNTNCSHNKFQNKNIKRHISREVVSRIQTLLERIDFKLNGSLLNNESYVFGPVIDNFWGSTVLDKNLMSNIKSIYFAGDITGYGRGIIQAIYSGLVISDSILEKEILESKVNIAHLRTNFEKTSTVWGSR